MVIHCSTQKHSWANEKFITTQEYNDNKTLDTRLGMPEKQHCPEAYEQCCTKALFISWHCYQTQQN